MVGLHQATTSSEPRMRPSRKNDSPLGPCELTRRKEAAPEPLSYMYRECRPITRPASTGARHALPLSLLYACGGVCGLVGPCRCWSEGRSEGLTRNRCERGDGGLTAGGEARPKSVGKCPATKQSADDVLKRRTGLLESTCERRSGVGVVRVP